jgi:general secretion pathway protein A
MLHVPTRVSLPSRPDPLNHVTPSEQYYGFVSSPFSLTPDLRFAYDSRSYIAAWDQVKDALRHREGLIVITGEIGTGKTMLCRALLEGLGQARTFLSVILDPCLTVDDLMYQVLTDFGISSTSARPTSGPAAEATRHQLVTTLQSFLASLIPLRAHAVIMIDEAQHLDPTVLEQIRLLSNFETDDAKLLQIVLVGQPDLDKVLARPDMQQLNQRVARRIQLQPLSGHEVSDYIGRRLSVASGDRDERLEVTAPFTTDAVAAIQRISRGVPRVINIVCDRALELGHEQQEQSIGRKDIVAAATRLKLPLPLTMKRPARTPAAAAAAALLGAAVAGGWLWSARTLNPAAAATATTTPAMAKPLPKTPPPEPSSQASSVPTASDGAPKPTGTDGTAGTAAPARDIPQAENRKGDSYNIAVAAFRTSKRANDVASDIAAKGLPVTMRTDASGGWYQVVVGPYTSASEAEAAQRTLAREGFADTRVSPSITER